jgi:tRNA(fMet)-specific endonuclease VapC
LVSLKYLLDTNILSEPLRPSPNQNILDRLQRLGAQIATASIVWYELLTGCYRLPASAKRTAIETYLNQVIAPTVPILPYDAQAAEWHAAERARLTLIGKTPPFADGQIIAIAKVNALVLVTANLSDYTAFQGVQLEDWRA